MSHSDKHFEALLKIKRDLEEQLFQRDEEIKRLRGALEKISKESPTSCDYNGRCTGFCFRVARSALAPQAPVKSHD